MSRDDTPDRAPPEPAPPMGTVRGVQRDAPSPLHVQISDHMRDLIFTRTWPPHHRVQTENELARELGVARGTVRKAVGVLVAEDLLVQVQGRGTFVRSGGLGGTLDQDMLSLAESMVSQGIPATTEILVQESVVASPRMAALLELPQGAPVILTRMERLRRIEEAPVAFFVNYVRQDLCPWLDDMDPGELSFYEFIEHLAGLRIAAGRRTFAARAADPEMAERLEVATGSPLQYFEQVTYLDDGRTIELSEVWVRSDRVRLTSMVSRGPAGGARR